MLDDVTVQAILTLLRTTTLSQRAIATKVGVNRETVHRIAAGKRFDAAEHRRALAAERPRRVSRAVRCLGCGGLIELVPCQLCRLRRTLRRRRFLEAEVRFHGKDSRLLGVDLKHVHLRRYLALRNAKIRRYRRSLTQKPLF
jgi:transcriptional regulator with XRE-family HTH domain